MIEPYIALFAVTTALVGIAGARANRSASVRWIAGSTAIFLVSVFAGIRDFEVGGPDVLIYGNRVFNAMLNTAAFSDILNYAEDRGAQGEAGYYFLNWAVSRFTADPHVFYAILAGFSSTCILIAVLLLRDYGSPVVMWLTYLFTAYVEGFNLLRQSPALALAVLGIALVMRGRYRSGLFVGAAGLLFHNSAVVFFVMWGVAVYLRTRREHVGRAVWLVLAMSLLVLVAMVPLLELLSNSLVDSKYQEYLGDGARTGRAFGIDALYRAVPVAIGVWALWATRVRATRLPTQTEGRQSQSLGRKRSAHLGASTMTAYSKTELQARTAVLVVTVLLSLELILLPVREISYPFYRLLAYFGYLRIIGYGLIAGLIPTHRLGAGLGAVAFGAAYFALIVLGRNEAYYSSEILTEWLQAN